MVRVQLVSVVVLITFLAHGRLLQWLPAGICVRGQYRKPPGLKIGNSNGNFQVAKSIEAEEIQMPSRRKRVADFGPFTLPWRCLSCG